MNLTGGGVTLKAGTLAPGINPLIGHTTGQVTEQTGDNTKADSFFDVFFEIDLGGGLMLYNHDALRIAGVLSCAPPSAVFRKTGNQPVSLFESPFSGIEVAKVYDVKQVTSPSLTPFGACCAANNHCTQLTETECRVLGEGFTYRGDGTPCGADGTCVPTVSESGLAVMTLLVLAAATVVIMRCRAIVQRGRG